ncbi:DMT family transporter [Salsipaludibacter albus]|uniref:DMT family transporter n=1 Tax=Salsipaludibacter albus TaxID=2849650 RepID=UPI001EE3AA9F|nr:DMT family transporter [Salsipaludibacter albus]MBY5162152.1 DMT family transporter [Salsipaludibacter albus]
MDTTTSVTARWSSVPDATTAVMYGLAVTLGAGNFVAVRVSNRELAPFWGAGLRFGLAALLFVAIVVVRRLDWPRGRDLWLTAWFGVFGFAAFYALMYWALTQVEAGLASVVLAIVPLATVLMAAAQGLERLRPRVVLGAVVAGVGIVWIVVGDGGFAVPVGALLAMLAAAVVTSESVILGKQVSGNHPAVTNAVGMLVGSVLLLAISRVAGETWALPTRTDVVVAVTYLVVLGSVGLFALVLLVVRRWTASATSYLFVLFPVVTMLLDAWVSDVPLTVRGLVGAIVVMAGVWVGALSRQARAPDLGPGRPDRRAAPVVPTRTAEAHDPTST